jgi:hypothetical protein
MFTGLPFPQEFRSKQQCQKLRKYWWDELPVQQCCSQAESNAPAMTQTEAVPLSGFDNFELLDNSTIF